VNVFFEVINFIEEELPYVRRKYIYRGLLMNYKEGKLQYKKKVQLPSEPRTQRK